jgi:WD40 repeat protein
MRVKLAFASLAFAAVAVFVPPAARAQYFGQNQVQYRDFDFKILKTAHYDVYYYEEEREQAEVAARLAERWYDRLSKLFEHKLKGRQAIMLYASPADFRQSNVVQGVGEGTGGVTEGLMRRVVLPSAGPMAETDHVLGHELVHAFQYSMSSRGQGGMASSSFLRLPLWFVEGLAEYLSLGPVDSQTAMWLRDAVASNKLPTLKDLGNPRYFPYRFGHAFWAYVGGRWGDDKVVDLFRDGLGSGDPQMSIKKVLGQDEKTFSKEWGEAVHRAYAGFLEAQRDPQYYGPELVSKKRGGGELNLGPALSPDGKRIVFLSEKDLFSIDLFLADADTGRVIRKLASTATDVHYDSLQFIDSAGGWSKDGRLFVQSALRKGKGALFIVEPETGRKVHEAEFKEISQVDNPTFTPDGKIVFSGWQGGLIDLWEYDPHSKALKRLTHDAFAEVHPAVSPDGKTIAFTTDRFTTKLDSLDFGSYRIGLLDRATGAVREAPGYPKARDVNPQWSPDGRTLFFLSDVNGATDVHRVDLATGELRQVTHLRTGITGITPLSPSLTVAAVSGRVAYTARVAGDHFIYAIDDPAKQAGIATAPDGTALARATSPLATGAAADARPVPPASAANRPPSGVPAPGATLPPPSGAVAQSALPTPGAPDAAPGQQEQAQGEADAVDPGVIQGASHQLPPATARVESKVEKMLEDPTSGLPPAEAAKVPADPYKSKMTLQYVGQPSIGVGMSRFGTSVGGSTALYFADMLGNHNLSVAVQAYGDVQDIAGQVQYANLTHRFDWAVGAQYVPYLYSGGYSAGYNNVNGQQLFVEEYLLERQTDASVFAIGAYPFNRADRLEVQASARRFGWSQEIRSQYYDPLTGDYLGNDKQKLGSGFDPLYLGSVSTALVHDTSVFGATSPILGSRARLEATPTVGSINYTDMLADVRFYRMPVRPVTFAVRAMHYGRYGSGSEDPRFRSLYIGYPDLIRGYDEINPSECVADPSSNASTCPAFDRLFGSRLLVGNAELRAPLWGLVKGRLTYGPVPVEIAVFADAGVAWFSGQSPKLFGGDQETLTSVGATARVNVFGFLVAELSVARPFQRPGQGWVWQWSITPGF